MRVLVTGTSGQVVSALKQLKLPPIDWISAGRPELDLADPASIARTIQRIQPAAIINAAAYTAVDRAEVERGSAHAINAAGAGAVAAEAAMLNIPVIHLSTDYVFNGTGQTPHRETDPVNPQCEYGRSKLAGEISVARANPRHVIVRTAWIYSETGSNFLKTMLHLAQTHSKIDVVNDQIGNPTYARHLAAAIGQILQNLVSEPQNSRLFGIFHCAGSNPATWADFAEEIFSQAKQYSAPIPEVRRVSTQDFAIGRSAMANRPMNSRLDCSHLKIVHGVSLPDWRIGVAACVKRVMSDQSSKQERP